MPVQVAIEYTPIRAPRGELTHAASFERPGLTLCGRPYRAWPVSTEPLDCPRCKVAALRRAVTR